MNLRNHPRRKYMIHRFRPYDDGRAGLLRSELPVMVSGYAKYMDVEESFDKDSVAGNS